MRQDNFYHCLTAFLLITVYTYTARQFCQLSYRVKLLAYASRDGKTIKSISYRVLKRQDNRRDCLTEIQIHQDNSFNCLTPFSLHLLHLHSHVHIYTHSHTSVFQVFDLKLAGSLEFFKFCG